MFISVVIPSVRDQTLAEAAASIRQQTHRDWELLLVIQQPSAGLRDTAQRAAAGDERVRVIELPRRGLSYARNAGVAAARHEIVAFTDDDCTAREDWLSVVSSIFEAEPNTHLVGGALTAPPKPAFRISHCPAVQPQEALYEPARTPGRAPPGWDWAGANFALRRGTLQQIGPFDECLGAGAHFPCGEDTDYKLRLEAAGLAMRTTPRSVVHHKSGTRMGLQAVLKNSRNYAYGNGALAGKLTLLGDPRGAEWLSNTRQQGLFDRRPLRIPYNLYRYTIFKSGHRDCIRNFSVHPSGCVLQSRPGVPDYGGGVAGVSPATKTKNGAS